MKLLLPFALFLVVVEGNLRGELSHHRHVSRKLGMDMGVGMGMDMGVGMGMDMGMMSSK
jgi:hypothetical protein